MRLLNLQDVLLDIYNQPEIDCIEFYFSSNGNDNANSYEHNNCNIKELAEFLYTKFIINKGLLPSFKIVFKK